MRNDPSAFRNIGRNGSTRQQAVTLKRPRQIPTLGAACRKAEKAFIIIWIADHDQHCVPSGISCIQRRVRQLLPNAASLRVWRDGDRPDQDHGTQRPGFFFQRNLPALDRSAQRVFTIKHSKAQISLCAEPFTQTVSRSALAVSPKRRVEQLLDQSRFNHGKGGETGQHIILETEEQSAITPSARYSMLCSALFRFSAACANRQRIQILDSKTGPMDDCLQLEVHDLEVQVLTGIFSEETHLPQPLRISVTVDLDCPDHFAPDTPLSASKNYMDIKRAMTDALPAGVHFVLIEAVADHIAETLFVQDIRVQRVTVKIVKLAIAEGGEAIGVRMVRHRR